MKYISIFIVTISSISFNTSYALIKKKFIDKQVINFISANNVKNIEKILRIKPEVFPDEEVIKVSFPRKDIKVTIKGFSLDPFMGITTWVSFKKGAQKDIESMIMGDLVLLEDEVNPIMSLLLDNGIKVTALHNHFFYDYPKIYFMHIEGKGRIKKLATILKQALDLAKQIKKTPLFLELRATNLISGPLVEKIFGVKGQTKDGMFKVVIGRQTNAGYGKNLVGKNMGVNTWAAFAGVNDNAIVDGDFAVLEDELQPVLKVLRNANINIVAIHNHMTHENPRIIFLHYWGQGHVSELASALKNALDKTKTIM